ncbi:MAG: hypothetical protein JW944_05540 [Deltaproteobacteria bacterium]|nr:hypothetical protein [Deltaproteobacteria bacterium]
MPIIKELPLEKHPFITSTELKSSIQSNQSKRLAHTIHYPPDDCQYLLGTPYFNLNFKRDIRQFIPLGQYKQALRFFKNTHDRSTMVSGLKLEYRSIVKALMDLGIRFRVVDMEKGDKETGRLLRQKGCNSLNLPYGQIMHWQIFPRDMFVYIKKANALLVHSRLFKIPSPVLNGCRIIHTKWGEGGRVLLSGDHMLLSRVPGSGRRAQEAKVISQLMDMGIKAAFLPYALFYGLSPKGEKAFIFHHSHIDLSASLIKGKDGEFHLIIDPDYRTGPLSDPLSVQASLDLVRRNCTEIGVKVHVLREPLNVPFSTAMVQFGNGKILATGGDDELLETISDIVSSENIRATDIPILQYPVFGGAGLHCLVTENPLPILSAID